MDITAVTRRAARPARFVLADLRLQVTIRLKSILQAGAFDSSNLDLAYTSGGGAKFYPHLELLTGNKLFQVDGLSKARLKKEYLAKMSAAAIMVYEQVMAGQRLEFPEGFWVGEQGKLNLAICFKHLLEDRLSVTMDPATRSIDERLFRKNQRAFLETACGSGSWTVFLQKYKLNGALMRADLSITELFELTYPWAFNLNTPKGTHLHPDEFSHPNMWQGRPGDRLARVMITHRFETHLGIAMDAEHQTFDPRLLRENQPALLASLGAGTWRDAFDAAGITPMMMARDDFDDKMWRALKYVYPWAFDGTKPEGAHLHGHDFDKRKPFKDDAELKAALLHETAAAGWGLKDLPDKVTRPWLLACGLACVATLSKLELFKRLFTEEFGNGTFTEANFRNEGSGRWTKPSRLRMIRQAHNNTGLVYGVVMVEGKKYAFNRAFIGWAVRKDSADHVVLFKPRTRVSAVNPAGTSFKPDKAFAADKSGKRYVRPELKNYSETDYPELSQEIQAALVEAGIAPHSLTLDTQKRLNRFVNTKGIGRL